MNARTNPQLENSVNTARRNTRRDELARETRGALITAARTAFVRRGYGHTSLDEIAEDVGLTKGAVYHHFASKKDLFRAVVHQVQLELGERVGAKHPRSIEGDVWPRFGELIAGFLDGTTNPDVRQILLVDGPKVLGWEEWRTVETQYATNFIETYIATALKRGEIPALSPAVLAQFFVALMEEAGRMMVAPAATPARRQEIVATLATLTERLRTPTE